MNEANDPLDTLDIKVVTIAWRDGADDDEIEVDYDGDMSEYEVLGVLEVARSLWKDRILVGGDDDDDD